MVIKVPELHTMRGDCHKEATRHQVTLETELLDLRAERADTDWKLKLALERRWHEQVKSVAIE